MNKTDDSRRDLCIAYIGGGSLNWAKDFMIDLALDGTLTGEVRLYDIDLDAARRNARFGAMISAHKHAKSRCSYRVVTTLKEALKGADVIIISILPGTFAEMSSDIHAPEKYGILQPVGDTTGPGGLMRALRTIPIFIGFAEAVRAYAPKAWVVNYTNPMALCTRTLYHAFPEIRAFGCCHEVLNTQFLLAAMVKQMCGVKKASREEIKVNVLGVNHFTWIDRASYSGIDLFPYYRKFSKKYHHSGYEGLGDWKESPFTCAHRIKFDLFLRYGIIAAAGDRHLVEFLPPLYLKDIKTVSSWKFHLTTIDQRIKRHMDRQARLERYLKKEEPIVLERSKEEGINQIKALFGMGDLVTNVNLPNQGQLAGVPEKAVVETNALFRRDLCQPVHAGRLPPAVQSLVLRNVTNQEMIFQAALDRDPELAFKAFMNDPLVTIDRINGRKLFDEMLKNIKAYLPGWKL